MEIANTGPDEPPIVVGVTVGVWVGVKVGVIVADGFGVSVGKIVIVGDEVTLVSGDEFDALVDVEIEDCAVGVEHATRINIRKIS